MEVPAQLRSVFTRAKDEVIFLPHISRAWDALWQEGEDPERAALHFRHELGILATSERLDVDRLEGIFRRKYGNKKG